MSKIDKEQLIELIRDGKTDSECAEVFDCSNQAVSAMRRKLKAEGRLEPADAAKATEYVEEKHLQTDDMPAPAQVRKFPLGVTPKKLWLEDRRDDLRRAICEFACEGMRIDPEWVEEYNELIGRCEG